MSLLSIIIHNEVRIIGECRTRIIGVSLLLIVIIHVEVCMIDGVGPRSSIYHLYLILLFTMIIHEEVCIIESVGLGSSAYRLYLLVLYTMRYE